MLDRKEDIEAQLETNAPRQQCISIVSHCINEADTTLSLEDFIEASRKEIKYRYFRQYADCGYRNEILGISEFEKDLFSERLSVQVKYWNRRQKLGGLESMERYFIQNKANIDKLLETNYEEIVNTLNVIDRNSFDAYLDRMERAIPNTFYWKKGETEKEMKQRVSEYAEYIPKFIARIQKEPTFDGLTTITLDEKGQKFIYPSIIQIGSWNDGRGMDSIIGAYLCRKHAPINLPQLVGALSH